MWGSAGPGPRDPPDKLVTLFLTDFCTWSLASPLSAQVSL